MDLWINSVMGLWNYQYQKNLKCSIIFVMHLDDVEKVCEIDPNATIIATHLNSVNHALVTRNDVKKFAKEKGLK